MVQKMLKMVATGDDCMNEYKLFKIKAVEVFRKSTRFDLIFKYLFVNNIEDENKNKFYEELYLESIAAFNGYYEEDPRKESADDFLSHFYTTFNSIKQDGFDPKKSSITLTNNGELWDGAHRLAICASLNLDVLVKNTDSVVDYNYEYFLKRGLPNWIMDLGALEFVKNSSYSYVATVHSCVDESKIGKIEEIFNSKGKIYYKKEFFLNEKGYLNLKKISYQGAEWLGSPADGFAGANDHAKKSNGVWPLRVYILISDSLSNILEAKGEVRELVGLGNYSIHVTDTHDESINISKYVLSNTSIKFMNGCPSDTDFETVGELVDDYINLIKNSNRHLDDFCVVSSYSMGLYGLRMPRDLDYIFIDSSFKTSCGNIDRHDLDEDMYLLGEKRVILDPRMHFYFMNVKFLTLEMLLSYKSRRFEVPKDVEDSLLILNFLNNERSALWENKSNQDGGKCGFMKRYLLATLSILRRLKNIRYVKLVKRVTSN